MGMHRPVRPVGILWLGAATACAVVQLGAGAQPRAASKLEPVSPAGLLQAVRRYRGKVVLLNVWATTCGPCVAELQELRRLDQEYLARGVQVVTFAMDPPEDRRRVEEFVREYTGKLPVLVRKPGNPEAFLKQIDRQWRGMVPVTYVFDRRGRRAGKTLVGQQTFSAFVAAVQPALGKRK